MDYLNILYGDELFYWLQSEYIHNTFSFILFDRTQPYFYPIILSIFHSVSLGRIINISAIVGAGYILLNYLKRDKISWLSVVVTYMLLALHPLTIFSGLSLYTEAIFTLLLCSVWFCEQNKIWEKKPMLYGLLLAVLLQTRVTGILVMSFLIVMSCMKREFVVKRAISYGMGILLFLPYIIFDGGVFFSTKIGKEEISLLMLLYYRFLSLVFVVIPFLLPLIPGIVYSVIKKHTLGLLHISFIVFIYSASLFVNPFFDRYWFILFPSFFYLSHIGLQEILSWKSHVLWKVAVGILVITSALIYVFSYYYNAFPHLYLKNRYFVTIPRYCKEVKEFEIQIDENNTKRVTLPYFEQPEGATYSYFTIFTLPKEYKYIFISYADDNLRVYVNSSLIPQKHMTYEPYISQITRTTEKTTLRLDIYNLNNIGGVGQVMLCKQIPQ